MTQLDLVVNDYIGKHKRVIGIGLLVAAVVCAAIGAWGVSISDIVHAAPLR